MKKAILITGGCGFIGHHVVEHFLKNTMLDIFVLDKLTYASNGFERLRDIEVFDDKRVSIFTADLSAGLGEGLIKEFRRVAYIVHLAAETHVDNSIIDPRPFVISNVVGTLEILQAARQLKYLEKFVYFSTDEVFGPALSKHDVYDVLEDGIRRYDKTIYVEYSEWDRYNSTNPYAATKAGGEELVNAFHSTYGLPTIITHTMNCFGERQHPEKFIPKIMRYIQSGKTLKIHADPTGMISGSRFYIHCRNVADAIKFLLHKGVVGEKYNVVGEQEVTNQELALLVSAIMESELKYELVDFHSSRPGHDLRYALDGSKMRKLGWEPPKTFEDSLVKTVRWTLDNPQWLKKE